MNNRYSDITARIIETADSDENVKAVIAIGSPVRSSTAAEYSDELLRGWFGK